MKYIPLTQGKFTIVDDEDYEWLNQFKWCFDGKYAIRNKPKIGRKHGGWIYMHRVITSCPDTMEVDHIDNDGLNNQKSNLRICTHQQNRANSKVQENNTSGYKCVIYRNDPKRIKQWMVSMKVKNKSVYIGTFLTKEKAALAYNEAATKYYGEFARLNNV